MTAHAYVEEALKELFALRLHLLKALEMFGEGPETPEAREALRMVDPLKLRLQALLERQGSRS